MTARALGHLPGGIPATAAATGGIAWNQTLTSRSEILWVARLDGEVVGFLHPYDREGNRQQYGGLTGVSFEVMTTDGRGPSYRITGLRAAQNEMATWVGPSRTAKKVDEYVDLTPEQKERFKGTTVRKDDKGYYCHTHRARSDSYESVDKIPASKIKFIESTGSLSVEAEADTTGVMVALVPPEDVSKRLLDLVDGDEPLDQQHLTLAYLGTTEEIGLGEIGEDVLYRAVYQFAIESGHTMLTGHPNGLGFFANGDENVLIALWDIPHIAEFRADLIRMLAKHGLAAKTNHGFTPHQTLSYADEPIRRLPAFPQDIGDVTFSTIVIAWGGRWTSIRLPMVGLNTV